MNRLLSPNVVSGSSQSWERVYETYSREGLVDLDAPIQVAGEIAIAAPVKTVWSVLTDVAGWPTVRSDISDVEPTLASEGGSFAWSTAGIRLLSRFGRVAPPREISWTTTAQGLVMTHVYKLQALGAERTRLMCEEAMTAPAAPQIGSDELRGRISSWLNGIKAVSEARREIQE
jgi:hypothetical protein